LLSSKLAGMRVQGMGVQGFKLAGAVVFAHDAER
jgi:hypothetical protein